MVDPVLRPFTEPRLATLERTAIAIYEQRPRHPQATWKSEPATVRKAIWQEAYAALRASGHIDMVEALRNFTDGREISYPQALECARAAIAKAEGR